ncbi:MAG: ATP synthase subunit I [Rhodoferax sp.]|nr:ATP synthase subunit I [Rhodoferax sp.]
MIGPASSRDDDDEAEFKVLTAEEARQLRLRNPPVSPWWVVAGQLGVGLVAALLAWALTGQRSVGWSVGYGALAVVIPAALFARGMMGRFASLNPATAAMAFFLWEAVKIGVSVALLALAPRMVPGLSWLAMLIGLVVTMKVYWVALLMAPKNVKL